MEESRIQRMARLLSETWPARMAKDAWQAVKLPGDVYQGNVPITGEDGRTSPEVINRAADLAGILMGGTYATAPAGKGELLLGSGPVRKPSALPMDEASRMGRAESQGYTVDAFKGLYPYDYRTVPSTNWKGEIIKGTEHLVPKELTSIEAPGRDYAGFFSSEKGVANRFADLFGSGAVLQAKLKFENPVVIDAKGKPAAAFQFDAIAREHGTQPELATFRDAFSSPKHDGVIIKNTRDEGTVYVPRNPWQVRSKFAAFDPANEGSGFLLGAGATDKRTAAILAGTGANKDRPIRAYHGSPHDFDKFDLSKIGTGEGAQAYGHGLYFAEREAVAKGYRDELAGQDILVDGKPIARSGPPGVSDIKDDPTKIAAYQLASGLSPEEIKRAVSQWGVTRDVADAIVSEAQRLAGMKVEARPLGRMYEVDIHAPPERFLDWDKPLAEQAGVIDALRGSRSKHIREIVNDPGILALERNVYGTDIGPMRGEDLFKRAAIASTGKVTGGPQTSAIFNKAGIPGIKYLDAGSRTAGAGSRNYVVFDDSIVEILKKYGLAGLLPAAGMGLPPVQQQYE